MHLARFVPSTTSLRLALACLVLAGLAADWPQLLGPDRNGHSAETGLLDTWPAKGPPQVWEREVGEGYASPVIASGRLILFHRVGNEDVVQAFDAATGKPQWKYSYATTYQDDFGKGDGPRSTPVVAGGKVYTLGAAGQLYCIDLKTGKKVWAKELHADYTVNKGFFGVATSPIVEDKLLIVNVGGTGAGIVAFDRDSGKEKWKATSHEASYSSPIAATVDGVRHVFFFTREGLVSVDPASGNVHFSKRWRSRIDASVNAACPVLLGGDHLLLTASYGTGAVLLKVKKDGVEEVWKNNTSLSAHFNTPVAVGDQLYGIDGRQEGGATLRCIDWKTGKVRWSDTGNGCATLLAADKKLFLLSEHGDLVLLRPSGEEYSEKARATVLGKPCRAHLALANGLLYARDGKKLVCWKVKK
jgi:outer membrane protein assembly factor BamB